MRNMISQVRNSNRSHRPQVGLTVLTVSLLTALAILFAGCKDKNNEPEAPTVPGTTENPNWAVTVDNDMTSSMTSVIKVSFASQSGTLAAFIGNDCCAIATYDADLKLYWLYISPASEQGGNVQLRFYSPDEKRIFDATSTFPFLNDTQLGTVASPHTPSWTVAK